MIGAAWLMSVAGCSKPAPPPNPPPSSTETPEEPAQPAAKPVPDSSTPEPKPAEPQRPTIPEGPIAGIVDGQPFEVASVVRDGSTVTFATADGSGVTLAFFGSLRQFEVLGESTFGSPHVYVRSPADAAAKAYVDGYHLVYNETTGELWLELPDGRGVIAGRFTLE